MTRGYTAPLHGEIPNGARVLWVASTGGHLSQLVRVADSIDASDQSHWITFDSPQSRGLLAGRNVTYIDYVAPRQGWNAIRAAQHVNRALDIKSFDVCVSTGATIAATILPMTSVRGIRTMYLESVSRTEGPSLTGRILQMIPSVEKFTQHQKWASRKWAYKGSVLDTWKSELHGHVPNQRRIFVTLGTIKPYRFDRLIDAVLTLLRPTDKVTWQLGCTTRESLPGVSFAEASAQEMANHANEADVVVSHAGVGSILSFLDSGIIPVLAVRRSAYGEHVDDHQLQIAREMQRRNLALELNLDAPTDDVLDRAASMRAVGTR